jgi:hypothetical protein
MEIPLVPSNHLLMCLRKCDTPRFSGETIRVCLLLIRAGRVISHRGGELLFSLPLSVMHWSHSAQRLWKTHSLWLNRMSACSLTLFLSLFRSLYPSLPLSVTLKVWILMWNGVYVRLVFKRLQSWPDTTPTPPDKPGALELSQSFSRNKLIKRIIKSLTHKI